MNPCLAGAISGIVEVTFTHPIDYVKTMRQQNIPIRNIVRKTSFKHYYSGYIPRVIGIIPMRLIFWGTQHSIEHKITRKKSLYNFIYIGTGAAFAQTIVDTSIEVLKITFMNKSKNTLSLFKGFFPTLYRNILFANCVALANQQNKYASRQTKWKTFIYAGIGGFIGSILSQPLDYVKTQKQLSTPDSRTVVEMLKQESIKTLFQGGGFRALLGMSTMSIGYFTYTTCLY
tara:strand:- start:3281 stop:3970 length:690 start_codon:yes stop_codon:yes gene_type:complete